LKPFFERLGLLLAPSLITLVAGGCVGYVPGAKSYWDDKVIEMCAKDGGVTVYQKVEISTDAIKRHVLPMSGGKLSVAVKELAHPDAPIYAVETVSTIRDVEPIVRRTESLIVRRADQAIVAKSVRYARLGGDLPIGLAEGTSLICPNPQQLASDLHEQLFVIRADVK
jgi:hypothetical protein